MSLITKIFFKHGICRSTFWGEDGEVLECIAAQDDGGTIVKGIGSLRLYEEIEWADHKERLSRLKGCSHFIRITEFSIMKEGWFALSRIRGTSDKGLIFS